MSHLFDGLGQPDQEGLDASILPTGVKVSQLWYPNHPWRRPRKRDIGFYQTDMQRNIARLTNAFTGETWEFPAGHAGYEAFARVLTSSHITAICDLVEGVHRFSHLQAAIEDPQATVYASEVKGVLGMTIRRGRNWGSVVSGASWHRSESGGEADIRFARDMAIIREQTGLGVYDTPAGLGTAALRRKWQERGLRHVLKLPDDMSGLMRRYSTGGIVTDEGIGRTFPILHEADIRQAYPTVVGLGLPWGPHLYTDRDPTETCRASGNPAFGYWTLYVTEPVEHSPIPNRDFASTSLTGGAVSWDLPVGRYDYAGWLDEIEALRATGKVYAQWRYGWVWHTLSAALKPWVDEMAEHREYLEEAGERSAAEYIKLSTNATIGTWSMDPVPVEVIDIGQAMIGDGCFQLPEWCLFDATNEPPNYTLHRNPDKARARPTHWGSYVRMRVRMEIYHVAQEIRTSGGTVVSQNFDAIQSTTPIHIEHSVFAWKHKVLLQALKPYPRATIAWVEQDDGTQEQVSILPGVPKKLRDGKPEKVRGP